MESWRHKDRDTKTETQRQRHKDRDTKTLERDYKQQREIEKGNDTQG